MKTSIAIVYDKFLVQGGGERVCEMLIEAFPDAQLYALSAHPRAFWEERLGRRIVSPPFGDLFFNRYLVTMFYPIAALLMMLIRVRADVVISYSSTCGKYVRLECRESVLYSNYPNRGLYQPEKLISSRFVRAVLAPVMAVMRPIERRQICKYDRKFSISDTSRRALFEFAGVDSGILMPPFNEKGLSATVLPSLLQPPSGDRGGAFLVVSRLEPEKELEYVIEAFRGSPHRLRVIGKGSLLSLLQRTSPPNVEFLGYVEDDLLAREIIGARALIAPSDIEYSLVPLESTYLGTPVVSFAAPAMREILIDVESGECNANAIFYSERNTASLRAAIKRFEGTEWDFDAVRASAKRFGRSAFIDQVRTIFLGQQPSGRTQ